MIFFQRQIAVPVFFTPPAAKIGDFRALLADRRQVIVELKTGREIDPDGKSNF